VAYSQKVIDRFESVLREPEKHAVGRFDPQDPNVATGMTGAPACGDVMRLQLKLNGDTIEDVKFKTYGCGSAIASSTLFVDMLKGKTIQEAKLIKDKDIAEALELPSIKLHCSVLAEDSIAKAIEDWETKVAYRQHNQQ
jgi:nitrogen fixation NifU-like protein